MVAESLLPATAKTRGECCVASQMISRGWLGVLRSMILLAMPVADAEWPHEDPFILLRLEKSCSLGRHSQKFRK